MQLTPLARGLLTAAATVPVAAAVWGVGVERQLFVLRRHEVQVLPPGSKPVRMLHLSDLHMAPWQRHKQDWVAGLALLEPDLVVNTGDNLGHRDGLVGVRRALGPLRGIPGVFVHGSNDLWGPAPRNPFRYFTGPSTRVPAQERLDTEGLDRFLADDLGWRDLNNTAVAFDAAGLGIRAFGVSDAHRHWDRLDVLAGAITASGGRDADLVLGVTHAPYRRVLDAYVELGAQLIIAGHTHGGQVRIPFSPSALVANCDLPLDQARGLSDWEGVPLNVSAGLGASIYSPVRFACRPEASLLTLLPRSEPDTFGSGGGPG